MQVGEFMLHTVFPKENIRNRRTFRLASAVQRRGMPRRTLCVHLVRVGNSIMAPFRLFSVGVMQGYGTELVKPARPADAIHLPPDSRGPWRRKRMFLECQTGPVIYQFTVPSAKVPFRFLVRVKRDASRVRMPVPGSRGVFCIQSVALSCISPCTECSMRY